VFVPELVLVAALSQVFAARKLLSLWTEESRGHKAEDWLGMQAAFFFIMGSFVIIIGNRYRTTNAASCDGATKTPHEGRARDMTYAMTLQPAEFRRLIETYEIRTLIEEQTLTETYLSHRNIQD
jgi:hypothetical protein